MLEKGSIPPLSMRSRPSSAPLVGSSSFRNLLHAGFAMQCEENAVEERQVAAGQLEDNGDAGMDVDPVSPQQRHGLMRALSKSGLFEMRAESELEAARVEVSEAAGETADPAAGAAVVGLSLIHI